MTIFAALLAQLLASGPLPSAMEAPVNLYVECINRHFVSDLERRQKAGGEDGSIGPKIMDGAIAACSDVRLEAIAASNRALQREARFKEAAFRQAFVEERFNALDALSRWAVSPDGDPNNWSSDVKD